MLGWLLRSPSVRRGLVRPFHSGLVFISKTNVVSRRKEEGCLWLLFPLAAEARFILSSTGDAHTESPYLVS